MSGDDSSVGVGGECHPDPFPTLVGVTRSSKEAASGLLVSPPRWGSAHEDTKGRGNPSMGSLPCLVWGSGSGDLALPDDRPYVYLFRGFADLGLGLFEVPVEVGLGVDEVADQEHALG